MRDAEKLYTIFFSSAISLNQQNFFMTMEIDDDQNTRFVRRLALKVKEGQAQDFLSAVRNELLPRTKNFHGLRRLYVLKSDVSPSEYVMLSFWNDKEDADTYRSSDTFIANSNTIREFLESDPMLSQFHIEAHHVNSDELAPPKAALKRIRVKKSSPRKPASHKSSRKKSRRR